ncbi:MAG: TRAP transporter small permease [Proteobacteria bacterium]|nr:TRAP transporter small permease [Pseudomonadota bacterium]
MELFSKFTDWIYKILLTICCVGLAAMVIIISAQVFCRFVLNFTPYWTEELTLIIMIYAGFFGAAVAYKKRLHINLQFFLESLPANYRKRAYFTIDCVLLVFALYSIVYGWQLTEKTMNQFNPALGWPVGTSYLAIPISGIIFMLFAIEKLINDFKNRNAKAREN